MKLKDVKNWIETLPEDFLEYEVMNAEKGELGSEGIYTYRLDKPVVTLDVDTESEEVLFINDTE